MGAESTMTQNEAITIHVNYSFKEDTHVFSSDDLPGLYIAHKDAQRAFEDVAPSIKLLLKLNSGIDCEVRPAKSYKDFERSRRLARDIREIPFLESRQYVATACI